MTELPSRAQYLDNETLRRLRADMSSVQSNREGVQVIGRNIFHVLRRDVVRRFDVENPVKPGTQRNPLELIHDYARPSMVLAAELGWGEETPTFRLLSTEIFLSAATTLKKRLRVQGEDQELVEEVERRVKRYKEETGISDQDQERVHLFMKYFTLSPRNKHKLYILLDEGKIDIFWQQLEEQVAEPKKKNPRVSRPPITSVKSDDGRRMQQVDREQLQAWLQRRNR